MKTKALSIAGHLINDVVFENGEESYRCEGGIKNVDRALNRLGWQDDWIHSYTCVVGGAEIEITREGCKKRLISAKLDTGMLHNSVSSAGFMWDSDWVHIAYLNHLPLEQCYEIFHSRNKDQIVSVDICANEPPNAISVYGMYLDQIDYFFASEEDIVDFGEIHNNIKGWLIVHSANGSVSYNKKLNKIYTSFHDYLPKANILGAGDFFAASFIHSTMKLRLPFENAIDKAHALTLNLLKTRPE